jgi:hypothetical protein
MPELRTLNETPFGVPIVHLFFHPFQIVHVRDLNRPTLQLQTPRGVETVLAAWTFFGATHTATPAILANSHGALANCNVHTLILLNNILFLIVLKSYDTILIELRIIKTNAEKHAEG